MHLLLNICLALINLYTAPQSTDSKHPVHVSVTNIELNETGNKLNITVKLFADDFITALGEYHNLNLKEKHTLKSINTYIRQNLIIKTDKTAEKKKLTLENYMYNESSNSFTLKLFLTCKLKKIPQEVELSNTLLTGLYRDQKNLLIFSCKNTEKAVKFDFSKTTVKFKIK
ncbi:MAG: DUF6702 family protein [Bacteroidota bacterium]|nr:DUF6702 family protein [Bacteroidota bacterium]